MDSLRDVMNQALTGEIPTAKPDDLKIRTAALSRLWLYYGETDKARMTIYMDETLEIPLGFLTAAVRLILRTHVYPSLPSIAEVWRVAREVAGMNREQYADGRYLRPPTHWPPAGKRHAIQAGELEPLPERISLPDGFKPMLGSGEGER